MIRSTCAVSQFKLLDRYLFWVAVTVRMLPVPLNSAAEAPIGSWTNTGSRAGDGSPCNASCPFFTVKNQFLSYLESDCIVSSLSTPNTSLISRAIPPANGAKWARSRWPGADLHVRGPPHKTTTLHTGFPPPSPFPRKTTLRPTADGDISASRGWRMLPVVAACLRFTPTPAPCSKHCPVRGGGRRRMVTARKPFSLARRG